MNKLKKHEESSTSLLRGIKKDIIWRDTLYLWMRRFIIMKAPIPKFIYKCNVKLSTVFFFGPIQDNFQKNINFLD